MTERPPHKHREPWPDAVIERAQALRARSLSFQDIAKRLAETMNPAPRWDLIRDWCNGRIVRAGRLAARKKSKNREQTNGQ